jgi:amidase
VLVPEADSDGSTEPADWVVAGDLLACLEPGARRVTERALAAASQTGARRRVDVGVAIGFDWVEPFSLVQAAEFWAAHGAWFSEHRPGLGPAVAARVARAAHLDPEDVEVARGQVALARARIHELVADDILVMGTAAGPPPPQGEAAEAARLDTLRLSTLASLSGLPALSLPLPGCPGGPVGLSLLGPAGSEHRLLGSAQRWSG